MPPERPSLIFVPGLVCDGAAFDEQTRAFAREADCRTVDHGDLDTIPGMAAALLREAPPRFALIGHSMGGRVALEVYRAAPERVAALALLDTGYQPRSAGEAGEREAQERHRLLDVARRQGMRAMGAEWVRGMVHPERLADAALIDAILDMIARKTPDIFAAQIRALLARPDAAPLLPTIRCPVMLMCGRQDSWSPLARHEQMAQLMVGATLEVIEDSGHMSTMERPQEVTASLRRWLVQAGTIEDA